MTRPGQIKAPLEAAPGEPKGARRFEVAPGMSPLLEAAGIHCVDDALKKEIGTPVAGARSSWVRRVPAGDHALYVKCFVYPTLKDALLRFASRRFIHHRALREWRSIELQKTLGLPVVEPVCLGELRRMGLLRASVIATEEFSGCKRLDDLLRDGDGAVRANAADAVAHYIARLHRSGFIHGDLNARNVLVRDEKDLRNVDSSHGRRRQWPGRLTIEHLKDLAPISLAFHLLAGPEREAEFRRAYAAAAGVEFSAAMGTALDAEIARIQPKESRRITRTQRP
jgi:serine/threonine-protein kinase RIO1